MKALKYDFSFQNLFFISHVYIRIKCKKLDGNICYFTD